MMRTLRSTQTWTNDSCPFFFVAGKDSSGTMMSSVARNSLALRPVIRNVTLTRSMTIISKESGEEYRKEVRRYALLFALHSNDNLYADTN
jgi:hypothetical protein